MRALIIDDSKFMRMILKRMLSDIGFESTEATNGVEGLRQLKGIDPPDLITVDWDMPEMDGVAFVHAVRQQPTYDHVPLVMVTTNTELEQVETALAAGANEYIMKPFTEEVVTEKLQLLGLSGEHAWRKSECL